MLYSHSVAGMRHKMDEHGRISPRKTILYSSTGSKITKTWPEPPMLETLPPSPEEEIFYEETVASSDEEDPNRMTDEVRPEENKDSELGSDVVRPEENKDSELGSDVVRPEENKDSELGSDVVRPEENKDSELGSDVVPFHKMCDKPEVNVEVPPCCICTSKAKPVSNEEKNKELSNMPEKIKKKSESFGTRDRSEMFKIEGDFNFDKEVKVMVKFDGDESNQYLDFFAVVKCGKTWSEIPAEQEHNQVIFKTKRMEYFFITSSPKSMTKKLKSESGKIFKHKTDPRIKVEFQKGSVENTTPISITVLPVIRKQLENLKNDFEKPIIEDMSPILIVSQPDKTDFNKPVICTLPCKSMDSCGNRKTLMVRLDHDDQAVISEVKTKDNDDGTHSCDVKSINMCGIVQTTHSISDDKSIMSKIRDEVLYVIGEAKRCVLQTFLHKRQRLIRTEIVEIINKHKVQEKIEKEGFRWVGESSKVITLRKGQRIRVDLTGRIRKLQKRKHFGLFVVFQPNLNTVGMEFGFEITKEMGTSQHGIIEYSSDNYEKRVLDTQHFDPSKPSSARPSLSRVSSALTDQHLVKQDGPLNIRGVSAQNVDIKKHGKQVISRDGSNLGSFKNCPQNTISPQGDPVKPRQARDVRNRVNHGTPRPKTSIGILPKAPITVRSQYINPQGLTRHKSDLTPYRNRQNKNIGYHLNLATDGRKAKVVSREDQVTCRQNTSGVLCVNTSSRPQTAKVVVGKNLGTQRSKTDICARANLSTPVRILK